MSKYKKKKNNIEYSKEFKKHQEKIGHNSNLLSKKDCFKAYPYLNKFIRRGNLKNKLHQFNQYAYSNLLNPSTAKDGNQTFFVSNEHLSKIYGSDKERWNKSINTYYFLGLLKKYSYNELQDTQAKRITRRYKNKLQKELDRPINPVSHYYIPKYCDKTLSVANEKAKQLIEKGYTITAFSKDWIRLNFDLETANKIYPNNKGNDINVFDEPIKYLLKECILLGVKEKGYITPKQLRDNVVKRILKELPRERNIHRKVEQIYRLYIDNILIEVGCNLRKANKELKNKFNLDGYNFIIYQP